MLMIPAAPGEVHEAFMDPQKHSDFTHIRTTGSREVGGEVSAGDGYISARHIELKKGEKIVQEWATSQWPRNYPPSVLQLDLREVDGGTELSMTHSNVLDEQAEDYAEGWKEYYWDPMVEYFRKAEEDLN